MPRWLRVIRGMIGTGLVFTAGVGVVGSMIAGIMWLLTGGALGREELEMVVKSAIWAFPVGVAFSGFLVIAARGLPFEELTLPRFAALGAGGGLLLFGVLALNAWDSWSAATALANATIFVLLGGGAATGTYLIARREKPALKPGDESPRIGEG